MKTIQLDIAHLKENYPNAWKDFDDFVHEIYQTNSFVASIAFEAYPFEFQLGVFYRYFNENGIELDICNIELELIPSVIEENFKGHDQAVKHFS
jgi:hypothetical protein